MKICRRTGKRIFRSAIMARIALNEAARKGRAECGRYQCEFCGGWHLTSHPWRNGGGDVRT